MEAKVGGGIIEHDLQDHQDHHDHQEHEEHQEDQEEEDAVDDSAPFPYPPPPIVKAYINGVAQIHTPTYGTPFTETELNKTEMLLRTASERHDDTTHIEGHSPAHFSIPISYKDYYCLNDGNWLNDNAIIYYNNILRCNNMKARAAQAAAQAAAQDTASSSSSSSPSTPVSEVPVVPNCYWAKTGFYTELNDERNNGYNYDKVKTWFKKRMTKKYGMENVLKEADLILVPLNLGEMHWALGVVDLQHHCFNIYDSMSRPSDEKEIMHKLQRWLIDEVNRTGFDFSSRNDSGDGDGDGDGVPPISEWPLHGTPKNMTPRQRNGYDCGVYSTQFGRYISEGRALPFQFNQTNMMYFRHSMAAEICKAEQDAVYPAQLKA